MALMDISIVLPSLNREFILKNTLPGYLKLPVKEIILCDDGSTDNTKDLAHKLACPQLIYHRNPKTLGSPASRNVGVQLSRASWILMGEDDVILDEDHITTLYAHAVKLKGDIVAGRLIAMQRGETPKDAKKRSDREHNTRFLLPETFSNDFSCVFPQPLETPCLHACALFKRDWALHYPYDENYRGNALREETDLYFRCHTAGAKMFFCSDAVAYHMFHDYGGGNRKNHIWYAYHSLINNHRFLKNHWPMVKGLIKTKDSKSLFECKIQIKILRMTLLFWMNAKIPRTHRFLKKKLKRN